MKRLRKYVEVDIYVEYLSRNKVQSIQIKRINATVVEFNNKKIHEILDLQNSTNSCFLVNVFTVKSARSLIADKEPNMNDRSSTTMFLFSESTCKSMIFSICDLQKYSKTVSSVRCVYVGIM